MTTVTKRQYRYLDSDAERRQLIEDIRAVRQDVLRIAERVPQDKWYEPRYHGWSLAAMLGHLEMMDRLSMWLVSLGALGINIPVGEKTLNRFNDMMANVFRQRVVKTTLSGLERTEKKITGMVMKLPMDVFSRTVYHPTLKQYLTVEQTLQEFFLYHWQGHLATMRAVDEVFYEPPPGGSALV